MGGNRLNVGGGARPRRRIEARNRKDYGWRVQHRANVKESSRLSKSILGTRAKVQAQLFAIRANARIADSPPGRLFNAKSSWNPLISA
jgi:hypothetical protein